MHKKVVQFCSALFPRNRYILFALFPQYCLAVKSNDTNDDTINDTKESKEQVCFKNSV